MPSVRALRPTEEACCRRRDRSSCANGAAVASDRAPRQGTPALRDHVLQVALQTLRDDGVSGFTTRKVAQRASTSIPAVYELFGDRGGLVRQMFFEGFRSLAGRFAEFTDSDDPRRDIEGAFTLFREFVRANPVLAEVMFSRPFADFDPGPDDQQAGTAVREFIVGHVRRCVNAGQIVGDATDIAHVLLAVAQGLASQESAGWLGTSQASIDRRWSLAFRSVVHGLAPP
jgi:AcrR family transcriptional regulator